MPRPDTSRPDPVWKDGWCSAAEACPSPNFNERPTAALVDLIVVHAISLPPGQYGGDAVHRLFSNTLDWETHPYFKSIEGLCVSSHFYIQRDGALWQFVSCDQRAWHAGVSFYRGRDRCNDDSIGIELEGLDGDTFTDAQYRCLEELCREVAKHYPIAHVAGHQHIAPDRKPDPGPGFEWSRLQTNLAWSSQCFPL